MKNRRSMHVVDWGAIGSGVALFCVGVGFKDEQARMIGFALLMLGVPRLGELVGWTQRRQLDKKEGPQP